MAVNRLFFGLLVLSSIFTICRSDDEKCVYTVYVKTGSKFEAGTDANISLSLYTANGHGIKIENLVSWGGLMGPGYNYFESGSLDIFSGRGQCLTESVCKMNLTSDGKGLFPGWYCDYVDVTTTGVNKQCAKIKFNVDQWLATDEPPYALTAIRNCCGVLRSETICGHSTFLL